MKESKNQKWKKFQGWKYNQTAYKLQYVHMNCGKHTSPLDTTQSLTACSCFGRYFLCPFTLRRTWPNTSQPIMVRWVGYWSAFDKQTLPTQTFYFQFHLFSVRTTHVQPSESRPHLHCLQQPFDVLSRVITCKIASLLIVVHTDASDRLADITIILFLKI